MKKYLIALALVMCFSVSYAGYMSSTISTIVLNETERAIYATPSGKCYHYSATCGGKNSKKITMEQAKERGLRPCSKCVKN